MRRITKKDISLISILRLIKVFIKFRTHENSMLLRKFIKDYYSIDTELPDDFYELLKFQMNSNNYLALLNTFATQNIYSLISYLKHNQEDTSEFEEVMTPLQYYQTPQRYINRIMELLKKIEYKNNSSDLSKSIKDEDIWLLKRNPSFEESECRKLAYKMYLSIGLDNTLELLQGRYGEIDYEKIHFLFSNLNTKAELSESEKQAFKGFLFDNKKDINNTTHQMLNGRFKELFLNFDYFYNNIKCFIQKLGTKMPRDKVRALLKERYIPRDITTPEITGDIFEDMLSSYYCKYESLSTPEQEVYQKNCDIYNEFLKKKHQSSIPQLEIQTKNGFLCEAIRLNDPRNLVLGYRSGNCFRINGDASTLFRNFLKSEHMRLLSISTPENKDYAMMLLMRNGNVLIGQGIEVSERAPSDIKGKKLYDACREALKEMMDYMNSNGDEIVATIIGRSNSNVANYNNQVLPFLVSPILENSNNYYNGIYNYQCLLDISEGKTLHDIKLYTPDTRYFDQREPILRRTKHSYEEGDDYREIEKRLMTLRFARLQSNHNPDFYQTLITNSELYTCCNNDWYITLFEDGTIDGFISNSNDNRAKDEYNTELAKIYQKYRKMDIKKPSLPKT